MSMFTAEYQDFKREDPTVLVKVTLYDDQKNVIKPAISKAKLVQGTKYAGDYEITQDGNQYCLSTKQVAKLPSGSYGMELWGDDGSIYPSAGFIPIRIHRNADNSLEQVDPTVDLNKIIEDMHNAGLNLVFDKIELLDSDQPGSITSSVHDGKNHITLRIPRGLQGEAGPRGFQGPAGKNFQIKQTFASIEAMNATKGAGFEDGDFALISSNIEDPDNSKLYVWNGSQFNFLTDMSGAQGIQGPTGPTPTMHVVSVTKSAPGGNPDVTYTKRDGGYDVSYVLPQGPQGENWKESDKQEILDEVKKELDSKISDAYTKAAADMDKWLETTKF